MASSEPLGPPVTHRFPANQRRHVERMRRFPLGWVLLGDAVSSFDPVYGQGITSAAMQAHALAGALDAAPGIGRRFARRYFRAAGRTVAVPWSIAVGGDFAYDGTTGPKPFATDLAQPLPRPHGGGGAARRPRPAPPQRGHLDDTTTPGAAAPTARSTNPAGAPSSSHQS